jgi:hypothetical protein
MADVLNIKPVWIPDSNQLYFTSKTLNSFQRATYVDTFGFYQQQFGLYGYMQMNRLNEFVVHSPKGSPLVWQPHTSCSYSPTGSLQIGKRSLTPDKVVMKEQFCYDELFDSCFEQLIEYAPTGEVMLDGEGVRILNELTNELVANAQLGARLSLTAGQVYDVSSVTFEADASLNIRSLFNRTHESVRGWIKLFSDMAANEGYAQLNRTILNAADFDEYGYNGSVLDVYDELHSNAPKKLKSLVDTGGIVRSGRFDFYPLFIVSPSMHSKLVAEYKAESEALAQNARRITKRMFGAEGSPTPNVVYYIDETPVVPVTDIAGYDDVVDADLHFAGIVASGNIQMGLSFSGIPTDIERRDIGVMIARQDDPTADNYGSYTFLSHALMKSALADPDFATATILATTGA